MKVICNTFKRYGNVMLQPKENGTYYGLLFRQNTLVERKGIEASIFITHFAIIEMEQEKFMKDLTRIGVRLLKIGKLLCLFCSMGNSRSTTAILIGKLLTRTMKVMLCEVIRRNSMRNKKKGLAVVPAVL